MKNGLPTTEELAREAREALSRRPAMTPREHFTWMVRKGLINARGQVTKLIGGSAEPEPDYRAWTPERNADGHAGQRTR
jgi:hypothetical protein